MLVFNNVCFLFCLLYFLVIHVYKELNSIIHYIENTYTHFPIKDHLALEIRDFPFNPPPLMNFRNHAFGVLLVPPSTTGVKYLSSILPSSRYTQLINVSMSKSYKINVPLFRHDYSIPYMYVSNVRGHTIRCTVHK